jgi:hypothetical protein
MQLNTIVALLAVFLGVALTGLSAADVHNTPDIGVADAAGQAKADAFPHHASRKPVVNR